MSDSCEILKDWKRRIENGEDPEEVIPYEIACNEPESLEDLYYYCIQVLPDGCRKEVCRQKLREVLTSDLR